MDRNLALELVRVTEAAALASARFFGKGDPLAAEHAAVSAMEIAFRGVKIKGHLIMGEENMGNNCTLCTGDTVGTGADPEVDIAVVPLASGRSLANGQANAISAIAIAERGSFMDPPSPYMRKIVTDSEAADSIDLGSSVFDNLVAIAESKRMYVEDLTVSILDDERHGQLIEQVRQSGARIELLREGDLASSIAAALTGTVVDVVMGTGSSREGITAAAAVTCVGGGMQARFLPSPDSDPDSLPGEFKKIYGLEEIVSGVNVMFAATGVSYCDFLEGIDFHHGGATTHSAVFRNKSGTTRYLKTDHFFDKAPDYT